MSALREAIDGLAATLAALPLRHALPPDGQRATRKAMEAIVNGRELAPAAPARDRLALAWREITAQCEAGRDPAALPARTLRDAIWLLWSRSHQAARRHGVLAAVFGLVERHPHQLNRCIAAWLLDFDAASETIAVGGRLIAARLAQDANPRLARWREASTVLHLFDPRAGPDRLAARLLADPELGLLTRLGFDQQPRASGGYLRVALDRLAARLPDRLRAPDPAAGLARAETLFVPDGKLRFDEPGPRGRFADGLVGAWANRPPPPDALREPALRLLTTQLGDPRMHRERWSEASAETLRIVLGWLTRATFAAFFDLIGDYAARDGHQHHWVDRRKFWTACLERGWIAECWLVLGENVHRDARISGELRGSYGRLVGSRPKHSALLMRIGRTVFAEWSHNGSLRAWDAGAAGVPRFGSAGDYQFRDLSARGLDFPAPSGRPEKGPVGAYGLTHSAGTWRERVAQLLLRRDNLRLQQSDWL